MRAKEHLGGNAYLAQQKIKFLLGSVHGFYSI
jgi:hypothetical protein